MSPGTSEWPAETAVRWNDTHRLILATYAESAEPFLGALTDDDSELADLVALAAATNARLAAQADRLPGGIGSDELVFEVPYSKIVNAAFTYPRPGGARFNSGDRGAWYAARSVRTSLAEVVFHRTLALEETDWWIDEAEYLDYLADIHAAGFADLRDDDPRSLACLDPDSYVDGQALAERLLAQGGTGVVYPSVRYRAGTNLACFRPAVVGNVRPGAGYRLAWHGSRRPTVELL